MNIIYLHTHDTGRWIQPYNPAVSTPNLMELAEEGTLFRSAYCCGPTCSPSRSALLTGEYPHSNGMLGLAHRGFKLKDYQRHLANYLKSQGYETALFGMQHEAAREEDIGYDILFSDPRREERDLWDIRNGDKALEYLRGEHKKPFFLSYGLECTHKPYPEPEVNDNYVAVPSCLPDTKETRRDFAGFLTSAKRADECLGRILSEVKSQGLEKDTLIIYTTDHGVALPHMKCTLYDTGIGVSLILKYPGNKSGGRALDSLVSQLDLFPTICELAGLKKPDWLQGVSLAPLLNGQTEEVRRAVFAEVTYHAAADPMRCVRTRRYKYIKKYGNQKGYLPANIDSGESKELLMEAGILNWEVPGELLFDLYLDPEERVNLAGRPDYEKIHEEMKALLFKHQEETHDFIGKGELPRSEGMVLNKASCLDADSENPEDYE